MAYPHLVQKTYTETAPSLEGRSGLGLVDFGSGRRAVKYDLESSYFYNNGSYEGRVEGAPETLLGLSYAGAAMLQMGDGSCYRLSIKSYDPVFEFCFVVATPA